MRALLVLVVLAAMSPRDAGACPDYDAALQRVQAILDYEDDDTKSIVDAYDELGEAWSCGHPEATLDDVKSWLSSVPSAAGGGEPMPSRSVDSDRIVVVWRRQDLEAGGRAVLYVKDGGGWSRASAFDLGDRPEVLGALGDYLVIGEFVNGGRISEVDLRALRVEESRLIPEDEWRDLWEPRVVVATRTRIKLRYQRLPSYVADGAPPLEYDLVIRSGKRRLRSRTVARTPALDAVEAECNRADGVLPGCASLHVTDVAKTKKGYRVSVQGAFVCVRKDGLTSLGDVDVKVSKVRKRLSVTGLSASGCKRVRPRKDGDVLL